VWTTPACPECGTQFRQEVHIPDHKARVAAVEVLLREGLGRPAQAEEPATPQLPESLEAVERMTWKEMQYVFASLYGEDLVAVQRDGGEAAVRAKLASLSDDQRRILREALAER
jgi:hypothetical protein